MPSQTERLHAHAEHLLDAFIRLRERFAMLEPMLFDERVTRQRGSGKQARGFLILRTSLFLSCAQDIAKLSTDSDARTPSIANLVSAVCVSAVEQELRQAFENWHPPLIEESNDPEIVQAIQLLHLHDSKRQRQQFEEALTRIRQNWSELSSSSFLAAFQAIRDRITAHTEVRYVADRYSFVDVGQLGLKWSELRQAIRLMQSLVGDLNLTIRNAGFAWQMLDSQLSSASMEFWLAESTAA